AEFFTLPIFRGLVDPEGIGQGRRSLLRITIDSDHYRLARFYPFLIFVTGPRDFALRKASFDGGNHAAHLVDGADVIARAAFEIEREAFEKIAASERVGHGGDAAFISDHLLSTQGERGGVFAGKRPRLVEPVSMERL